MLVEDDRRIRERFARAIGADARITLVEQAATGGEAIARLAALQPDVLLVDLGLPDMHGTEVIRHAARAAPKCDIMVITVFADERSVLELASVVGRSFDWPAVAALAPDRLRSRVGALLLALARRGVIRVGTGKTSL